jgi:C-terminal processing protease CtpA/Prc
MKKNRVILMTIIGFLFLFSFSFTAVYAIEEVGGIGIELYQLYNHMAEDHRGLLIVVNVFKESPAEQYGIEIGDIILEIDGIKTWKRDFKDILQNKLRGKAGTEVKFKIYRPRTKQIISTVLTRAPMAY